MPPRERTARRPWGSEIARRPGFPTPVPPDAADRVVRVALLDLDIAPAGPAACECRIQGRFLRFRSTEAADMAAVLSFLEVDELADRPRAEYVVWTVRIDRECAPGPSLRLRFGTPATPGLPLCALPLDDALPEGDALTYVIVNPPGCGFGLDELRELIQQEPVYVELEAAARLKPRLGHLSSETTRRGRFTRQMAEPRL
jgi:hypothetical protein